MKYFLRFSLALVLLFSIILSAQTVTGKLVDQNGIGLGGVQLQLYRTQNIDTAISSADGSFTFTNVTEVKDQQLPTGYSVSANYPNPFNPRTRLEITLPNNGTVKVELYNQIGQKVRADIEKYFTAGNNSIDLELNGLANGFYIARINVDGKYDVVRKLMLIYGSQHLIKSSPGSNSGLSKSNPLNSISTSVSLDSLVATSVIIGRKTFLNLPKLTGNTLDLGNKIIERYCSGIPTILYSGKRYNTVQIGTQCFLKENLDVGTMIYGVDTAKNNGIIEKYCYNDSAANCSKYGGLYQLNEAMQYVTTPGTKGICPTGWHIPTYVEFYTLGATLSNDGDALKAIGQGTGTNSGGFSALLAGLRSGGLGDFGSLGSYAYFWSSTENLTSNALYMQLYGSGSNVSFSYDVAESGISVRCAKDF
jgi:uncharacterized protein (TIGR02145 family)